MRSRIHFKTHPVHPILAAFPIAFLTGALIFDLLFYFYGNDALSQTAYFLTIAGIAGGLLAAIPGVIDLLSTVPPKSSARTRGIKHGVLNTIVLLLFGCALIIRSNNTTELLQLLAIEGLGVILMGISGFLGGTLVYRNQIGVDIRYAGAGKWKEIWAKADKGNISIEKPQLDESQMMLIHADDRRIVLTKTDGSFIAFDDRCPHRGGSLAAGSLACGTVQCPWHGSQFDVSNGSLKAGPAKEGIRTYPVSEDGEAIHIHIP